MSAPLTDCPEPDDILEDVMARWPATTGVFLRRQMACPGCAMAHLMTLREAAVSYHADLDDLLADLRQAAGR